MEAPAAMDAADDDARGFKAVFTAAGEELLQGRMREKLREFRRSESDPEGLLLDYVMVLLKNERCKNKTIEDLHVFLGNDSDAFVSCKLHWWQKNSRGFDKVVLGIYFTLYSMILIYLQGRPWARAACATAQGPHLPGPPNYVYLLSLYY